MRYPRDLTPRRPRPGPPERAPVAALRVTRHPAGPFAAPRVEGVLPRGTAMAVARLLGTDPALEDGYLALIRRHARASARALPD